VNRSHYILILFVTLLCSCVAHRESDEGADSERLRGRIQVLDRSNSFVKATFEIMEIHAELSGWREAHRARGVRVCEEGEDGTNWKERCNTCSCEWGVRICSNLICQSPERSAQIRAQAKQATRELAELYREIRERDRARGVRVCEEGEDGTIWKEGSNTCWCKSGVRYCDESGPPRPTPPDPMDGKFTFRHLPLDYREITESRQRCKEEEKGTSWKESCLMCWCEAEFRVCSRADCPRTLKSAVSSDDPE
jgi:hypothetical protein